MPRWTPESRRRQAVAIRQWHPWEQSTGPTSRAGRRKAAQNSLKTGQHTTIARLNRSVARVLGIDLSSINVPEVDVAQCEAEWLEFIRKADLNG